MANIKGDSNTSGIPAVSGENTASGGLGISGFCATGHGVHGESKSGKGVYGYSETYQGVSGKSIGNAGVVGESTNLHGVYGTCHNPHGAGVYGTNDQVGGFGVQGINEEGDGVIGTGRRGVVGISDTYQGVYGWSRRNAGVVGESVEFDGVFGISHNPEAAAVSAHNPGGRAGYFDGSVWISAVHGIGAGVTSTGKNQGVAGFTSDALGVGVHGVNFERHAHGILGAHDGSSERKPVGVFGANWDRTGYAGFFAGNVAVTGELFKSALYFRIDHPLDPANKYLCHSSVECPDMKNIYDGTVILDENGEAVVTFPLYVESLNEYFRYQLTAIGAASPNLHITEEICDGCFKIAGGNPNSKVSWQVTGIRKDPYARKHPVQVEQEKPSHERGKYLHAEEYELSETMGIENEMKMSLEAKLVNRHY